LLALSHAQVIAQNISKKHTPEYKLPLCEVNEDVDDVRFNPKKVISERHRAGG
jgi:hypothetical protein